MLKLLLAPGVKIVSQLQIATKFSLIFLLYLIPVAYVAHYAITEHSVNIESTQQEIEKLELISSLKPIFTNIAKSRGLTNSYLHGHKAIKPNIINAIQKADSQFYKVENKAAFAHLTNNQRSDFNAILTDWNQLKNNALNLKVQNSFLKHSKIINRINFLMNNILESSDLFIDSDHQASYLIQMLVKNLPAIIDITGKTRGVGAGVATAGTFNADSFIALSNHNKLLESLRSKMSHNFKSADRYGDNLKKLSQSFDLLDEEITAFIDTTANKILIPDSIGISGATYFSEGTLVISGILSLYDDTYSSLNQLLVDRAQSIQNEILINVSSSILLVLAAIYLFASVYINMLQSISRIEIAVNGVAEGDLTLNLKINSKDELNNIGNDLNRMIENTRNLVRQVSETTKNLVSSAENNSQSAELTSEKINEQNIEVEQVATAMNEMSATVQEVARNAEQTAQSTASADNDSKNGFDIVQNTIKSISELANEISNASSSIDRLQGDVKDISSVLDVIQGIADQTNLLALNAAIEAARAGESGRGFAVVADEVRALASKTQESTEEIRSMINKLQTSAEQSVSSMDVGNDKIHQTVQYAETAGAALQKISESVGQISLMGEQIASAATEQSTVAEEINRSIMSVKDISSLTLQSAKGSSENSHFVKDASNNLQELVSHFKV